MPPKRLVALRTRQVGTNLATLCGTAFSTLFTHTHATHKMSFAEAPAPVFTAADLLAFDESQLVRYLESNSRVDGGFDISNAASLESLSKSQRDELGSRLRAAAPRAENATASRSINMDALLARLTSIEGGQDGSPELGRLRSPPETSESARSTVPPDPNEEYLYEASSYHELIQDGGRPVCPIEVLSHILDEPAASYEPILPWLSHLDSASRNGEIQTVFSRQLDRWWDFCKWQWDNRGTADGDGGFSAFLAAKRSKYERIGDMRWVSDSSFEETMLRLWQQKPELRLLSDDQEFPAYREAVKRRLAPHNFNRPLQLMKDPRKQTEWTTWLEYLNFEQWWLERHAAAAEAEERQYHQAWKRLLEARRQNTGTVALAKQLAAAQANLDTAMKAIDDFIRDTAHYRRAEAAVYHQKNRVQWVLKEARVMEAEVPQQRGTARNNSKSDAGESKKRRRSDDDVIPSESWSKRTRRGGGGKDAVPDTVSGQPRRSQRMHFQSTSATRSVRLSTRRKRG
ncbi:hypothetical protein K469DRAFT_665039 [Zopfia rhizophila CBS 207.26]|uniref:Uncharacterized protein n=1 Tax=Zopfia rhizophila CBS 207.26 TaxID=1314779 RepID=A0A6A6E0H6_9PEZI|nr:hypothetical protein K469DRAFT_665039 [Zopfia rhizophila CBS 207.26]